MVFTSRIEAVQPAAELQDSLSLYFWRQLDAFAERTLLVDHERATSWTGGRLKAAARRLALNLAARGALQANANCALLYRNCDHTHLAALAVLFAGGALCVGAPEDPEAEHRYLVQVVAPSLVFVGRRLVEEARRIRAQLGLHFALVLMDDEPGDLAAPAADLLLLNGQLLAAEPAAPAPALPVLVHPDRPAFILLTSGSTGRPKPVGRSQRNSLHVCHSLAGAEHLWRLDASSVLAGHLQLDHGTGLFCLKMALAQGLKLVVMHGYEQHKLLEAVQRHAITDVLLGSAFVHQLLVAANQGRLAGYRLHSLANVLAVGSPLASHELARDFMRRQPQCSVRQAFGMTECGFISIVERERAHLDHDSVGHLLAGFSLKLLDQRGREIADFERPGELLVGGPKVSPGYLGARFRAQSAAAFGGPGGFYRSGDLAAVAPDGRLRIRGRLAEVLCLHDGWKVLPLELEQLLAQHPAVLEAAVVGVPHPEFATCHAPRAYVVLRPQAARAAPAPTERDLCDFVAARAAEPKHLVGGVKILERLPRISVGKVDKQLLKRLDGL